MIGPKYHRGTWVFSEVHGPATILDWVGQDETGHPEYALLDVHGVTHHAYEPSLSTDRPSVVLSWYEAANA